MEMASLKTLPPLYAILKLLIWAAACVLILFAVAIQADTRNADVQIPTRLSKLAFGSCSKQYKKQVVWDLLLKEKADAFVWTGDAVYVNGTGGPAEMSEAFDMQMSNTNYTKFLESGITLNGVWDDHDFGVNDGGEAIAKNDLPQRLEIFHNFLGTPRDSVRRQRDGLYSSMLFGEADEQVKVLLLDVRSHRAPYAMDVGARNTRYWAIVSALARALSLALGRSTRHRGDILGTEEQWAWLEEELRDSTAAAHIIISSMQVFSTTPFPESWAYFPQSRRRLLDLLSKYNPPGLLFISGDVHMAELLSGTLRGEEACGGGGGGGEEDEEGGPSPAPLSPLRPGGARDLLEVTSSGMTHAVAHSWYGSSYTSLKRDSLPDPVFGKEGVYFEENYGILEFEWPQIGKEDQKEIESAGCQKCPMTEGEQRCEVFLNVLIKNIKGATVFDKKISSCGRFSKEFFDCLVEDFPLSTVEHVARKPLQKLVLLVCIALIILRYLGVWLVRKIIFSVCFKNESSSKKQQEKESKKSD